MQKLYAVKLYSVHTVYSVQYTLSVYSTRVFRTQSLYRVQVCTVYSVSSLFTVMCTVCVADMPHTECDCTLYSMGTLKIYLCTVYSELTPKKHDKDFVELFACYIFLPQFQSKLAPIF